MLVKTRSQGKTEAGPKTLAEALIDEIMRVIRLRAGATHAIGSVFNAKNNLLEQVDEDIRAAIVALSLNEALCCLVMFERLKRYPEAV